MFAPSFHRLSLRAAALLAAFAACYAFGHPLPSPAMAQSASASAPHTFIVAANDGYGVEDCLSEGSACGQVVADAWCEAHGLSAAVHFGPADDVTGATGRPA